MDPPEIWCGYSALSELSDVRHVVGKSLSYMLTAHSLVTLFLFMVAELSALQQIINALTGINGLWPVIVECIVTTIYTCKPR